MAHMAEEDGIIGPDDKGEHAPVVRSCTPSLVQDDDIYLRKRTVLQVAHDSGELYQVIIQLLLLLFFSLCFRVKGEYEQDKQSHQNPCERPVSP
jgi:hypothetical protein